MEGFPPDPKTKRVTIYDPATGSVYSPERSHLPLDAGTPQHLLPSSHRQPLFEGQTPKSVAGPAPADPNPAGYPPAPFPPSGSYAQPMPAPGAVSLGYPVYPQPYQAPPLGAQPQQVTAFPAAAPALNPAAPRPAVDTEPAAPIENPEVPLAGAGEDDPYLNDSFVAAVTDAKLAAQTKIPPVTEPAPAAKADAAPLPENPGAKPAAAQPQNPLDTMAMAAGKRANPEPRKDNEDFNTLSTDYQRLSIQANAGEEIARMPKEDFDQIFLGAESETAAYAENLKANKAARDNYITCAEKYSDYVEGAVFLDRHGRICAEAGEKTAQEKLSHFSKILQALPDAAPKLQEIKKLQEKIAQVKPPEIEIPLLQAMANRAKAREEAQKAGAPMAMLISTNAPINLPSAKDSLKPIALKLSELETIKQQANAGFYDIGKVGGQNMAICVSNDSIRLGFRDGENFTACGNNDEAAKPAMTALQERLSGKEASGIDVAIESAETSRPRVKAARPADPDEVRRRVAETRAGDTPAAPVTSSSTARPAPHARPRLEIASATEGVDPEVIAAADEVAPEREAAIKPPSTAPKQRLTAEALEAHTRAMGGELGG